MLRQCPLRSREYSSLGWSSVSTGSSWNVKTTGRPGVHGHQLKLLCCLKHMRQQVYQSSSCHWPIETEFSAISRCLYVNRISHPWGFGAEPRHPLRTTSLLFHNGFCLVTGPQWRRKLNRALPSYQVSWAVHHTVKICCPTKSSSQTCMTVSSVGGLWVIWGLSRKEKNRLYVEAAQVAMAPPTDMLHSRGQERQHCVIQRGHPKADNCRTLVPLQGHL